jgi:hypothetical protein
MGLSRHGLAGPRRWQTSPHWRLPLLLGETVQQTKSEVCNEPVCAALRNGGFRSLVGGIAGDRACRTGRRVALTMIAPGWYRNPD